MAFYIPDKKEQKTGSFQECSEELGEHETKYPVLEKLCILKRLLVEGTKTTCCVMIKKIWMKHVS